MAEVCDNFEYGPDHVACFCNNCGHSLVAHVEREGRKSPAFLGGMGEDNE